MEILENITLKAYNTFAIDAKARYFSAFNSVEQLSTLTTDYAHHTKFILGGGSNILFIKDYDGIVLKNEIKGIEKYKEDEDSVYLRVGAGENWHQFVLHCIKNGWGGIENLSLIPGCVGASPMQNIGAYGVELSSVFQELKAFHLQEKTNYTFTAKDCAFGYRDSVFKGKYKDQFVILNVSFRLSKKPVFNTSYGALEQELEKMGVKDLSIKAISDAVIRIRSSKLPDPNVIGNAGSFFKNPTIGKEQFDTLQRDFPGIVAYPNTDGKVKLAAGWLIEHTGPGKGMSWKGFRIGDAGCHERQALVLVNHGQATGDQVFTLSEEIRLSVIKKFGISLEREVNIV
jgi:UDP-N-acetylmuramate dehydrogenase